MESESSSVSPKTEEVGFRRTRASLNPKRIKASSIEFCPESDCVCRRQVLLNLSQFCLVAKRALAPDSEGH